MAFDALRKSSIPRVVGDTFADLGDLIQKEFALARAEISEKINVKLSGAGFLIAAGLAGLLGFAVLVQALILGIASYGIALHLAASLVGGAILVVAALLFLLGRSKLSEPFTPTRSFAQVEQDVRVIKERLR